MPLGFVSFGLSLWPWEHVVGAGGGIQREACGGVMWEHMMGACGTARDGVWHGACGRNNVGHTCRSTYRMEQSCPRPCLPFT